MIDGLNLVNMREIRKGREMVRDRKRLKEKAYCNIFRCPKSTEVLLISFIYYSEGNVISTYETYIYA